MSCLDVMYHKSYGAHQYLPSAAAAAYTAAYYHHHHHHSQQQKLALYSKMQESVENNSQGKESEKEQAPEAEYISSRCILLTYVQGDVGAVVDEHFNRALSHFNADSPSSKTRASSSTLWKEGLTVSANQKNSFPASFWSSTYQPPAPSCLSGNHHDFSAATGGVFHPPDSMAWPGHGLHQAGAPPPNAEAWSYTLASQGSPSYPLVHDVYPHMHHPHAHHHNPHLDPRYGSLLVPSVRAARIAAAPAEITKTEATAAAAAASPWTGAFHGTLDMVQGVDTGLLHQDKSKEPTWF